MQNTNGSNSSSSIIGALPQSNPKNIWYRRGHLSPTKFQCKFHTFWMVWVELRLSSYHTHLLTPNVACPWKLSKQMESKKKKKGNLWKLGEGDFLFSLFCLLLFLNKKHKRPGFKNMTPNTNKTNKKRTFLETKSRAVVKFAEDSGLLGLQPCAY